LTHLFYLLPWKHSFSCIMNHFEILFFFSSFIYHFNIFSIDYYYTNATVKTCYVQWAIYGDVCLLLKHWLMSFKVFTHCFIKMSCNEYSVHLRFMVILLFRTWNQLYVDSIICTWFFVVYCHKCVCVCFLDVFCIQLVVFAFTNLWNLWGVNKKVNIKRS
jgi:hypothetical protein